MSVSAAINGDSSTRNDNQEFNPPGAELVGDKFAFLGRPGRPVKLGRLTEPRPQEQLSLRKITLVDNRG